MPKECDYCGFRDPMPFTCKYCGNSYCYNHRLPETHNCPGLADYKERVRSGGKIYQYDSEVTVRKPGKTRFKSLANAVSVIRSNYSLTILILAIISFLLQGIIPEYKSYLALTPSDIFFNPLKYMLNLITHMFLHNDGIHLLFNMMFLFFFGPELERRIGGKRFLAVFFISGIVAAIGYSVWTLFVIHQFSSAVGASGALFGIFACLAVLAPNIIVYVYFIPMKITHALVFFALLDLLFIGSAGDMIARSAHLSGVIAGLAIGKHIKKTSRYIGY